MKRRRKSVECRGGWARGSWSHEDRDEEQLGETEGLQQCKRSIQQRVLGARNSGVRETRSQLATGARQKEKL